MEDILPSAGEAVVHAQYLKTFRNKAVTEMRAKKASAAGYQYAFIFMIFHKSPFFY